VTASVVRTSAACILCITNDTAALTSASAACVCCQADKVEQLHETLAARFGVALVGPAGAGKTVCYTLLAQARSWLWREQDAQQQRQQQQQQQWQQDHSTDDIRSVRICCSVAAHCHDL
jgi:ABC-type glutathione transport system ATPase component